MDTADRMADLLAFLKAHRDEYEGMTAEEVGRRSIEDHIAQITGTVRTAESTGRLRFTGNGVAGHSIPMKPYGDLMSNFQGLVSAVGGHMVGAAEQGPLPAKVAERTALAVVGAPGPGSVVANLRPVIPGIEESEPEGPSLTRDDEAARPLADRAMVAALELLNLPDSPDLDAWAEGLRTYGPRTASNLKAFAQLISRADVDVEASWSEPGRRTRRSTLTATDARRVMAAIQARNLDAVEVTVEGTVVTVSNRRQLEIDTTEGVRQVKRGDLTEEDITSLHVGAPVRIRAQEMITESPGGASGSTITAVELLRT